MLCSIYSYRLNRLDIVCPFKMKFTICFIYTFLLYGVVSSHPIKDIHKLRFTKSSTSDVSDVQINDLSNRPSLQQYSKSKTIGESVECFLCKNAMSLALWRFKTPDKKYTGLFPFVIKTCEDLDIEAPDVCNGIVNAMKNETQYLLSTINVTGEMICGLIFPSLCEASDLSWNKDKWIIPIPKENKQLKLIKELKSAPGGNLNVLHISDIHMDTQYQPGAKADCKEPLCCQSVSTGGDQVAGYWGSHAYCDTPYWTIENLFSQVSKQKFDYILWTGDLPAHNVWSQSKNNQLYLLQNLTTLLVKYFPNTPIYPALGNHESFPVNSFPPNYVKGSNSINWLYDALAKAWSPWLPKDALDTVRQSGFYTALVRKGFRIVSLNMNYCNGENFWMLLNPVDPNGELQWLIKTLSSAEQNDEKVHIIGHIPPSVGRDCLAVWRNNYYNIIANYKHIIVAQFFGHTHKDEMEILYKDDQLEQPISMAYIAPSVTTYYKLNPGYRVYEMDGADWSILDHHTYILNLTKANQPNSQPIWELEYSAKHAYNLTSLSLDSWHNLYQSWMRPATASDASFQKYYNYYYKGFPPAKVCDDSCKKKLLCTIAAGNFTAPLQICN